MKTKTHNHEIAELDLIIHNLNEDGAKQAFDLLQDIPGIEHVRLTDHGAFLRVPLSRNR